MEPLTKDAAAASPKPKRQKKDDFQILSLLNSEAVLGIYQRLRAVETVCFEFFKMSNALVIPIAAKAAGKRIAEQRKVFRDQGKTWKLEHPIHAVIWLAVVVKWRDTAFGADTQEYKDITEYLAQANVGQNMKQVAHDICYFRVLDMKKKENCKLIVNCQSEGSATCKVWLLMAKWTCAPTQGGERLQGVAPRNGKERKIAKTLDKAKGKNN